MQNESAALLYQFLYHYSKVEDYYQLLFEEVLSISCMVVRSLLKRYHLSFSSEQVYDISVDAATRLMERIRRRNPAYVVRTFRSTLYLEVKYQLHNKKKQQVDQRECSLLDEHNQIPSPTREYGEDTRTPLDDILSLPQGRRIVIDLYRATSYKKGILAISKYTPKRVIYDFAKRLHLLYEYTRIPGWSRRSKK